MNVKLENPIIKIREKYEQFHKKERDIADYILKTSDEIIYQSVQETAQGCGVSKSSVVRFCKSIGYSGYSELKTEIAKAAFEIQYREEIYKNTSSDSFSEQLSQMFSAAAYIMEQLRTTMDYSLLIRVADIISESRLLLIYGMIYSGQTGFIFCERMKTLGIPSFLAWDHISMKQISILSSDNTSAIFISHSGASKDTLENALLAKSRNATVIAITSAPSSPLAKAADIVIPIPSMDSSLFRYYYPIENAFSMVLAALSLAVARKCHKKSSASTEKFETEIINDAFDPMLYQ